MQLGRRMLSQFGHQVTALGDSPEALAVFKSNPEGFDAVITDQTMPELSSVELAQEILKIRPDIPIVLCTGYSEKFTRKHASEMGVNTFLMKPLVMKDLAGTVRQALTAN